MTTKVAMQVNPENLVKSLQFSFTHKTTFLGELMQNSRRAGASSVVFEFDETLKTLSINDDGIGIDAIEILLTVAESGWNAEIIAQEHPFGIGFLSVLFACQHITVLSNATRMSTDTAKVLAFEPVTVEPVIKEKSGTAITMKGVNLKSTEIHQQLKELAKGFPIPVRLNGEVFSQEHAFKMGHDFVMTDIGFVKLSVEDSGFLAYNDQYDVYLQGLPIYKSCFNSRTQSRHIIHLDPKKFHARLPDRDKLINEQEVRERIEKTLKKELLKFFECLKNEVSAEEFVKYYWTLKTWDILALLNDVPAIPCELFKVFESYPVCNEEMFGDFLCCIDKPMSYADVKHREVVVFEDSTRLMTEIGSARYMFAWKRDCLVFEGGLDEGHWIYPMLRHLDSEKPEIELRNKKHSSRFQSDWNDLYVTFCEAYRIKIGNDVVEFTENAFYTGMNNDDTVIVPAKEVTGCVLEQASSYQGEFDDFQSSVHDLDESAFSSFIVANTANNPADALKQLLPDFSGCPLLNSEAFVVTLNEFGHVASIVTAPDIANIAKLLELFLCVVKEDSSGVVIDDDASYTTGFTLEAAKVLESLREFKNLEPGRTDE